MKNLSILIKPASGNCNMNCKYCFYYDVMENREVQNFGMMKEEVLELIIKKAFAYADNLVNFAFQGGEPTLRGLEFFEKLIELVKVHNTKNIEVGYSIQTNGLLIDDIWAEFFAKNKFLLGLSLDGTKDIHDVNRLDRQGKETFNRIEKNIKILKKYNVDFNILCVVTKNIAKHPKKVYDYFRKNNFQYLQFIPCLDELDGEVNNKQKYSLTPELYGDFLCQLFDLWHKDFTKGQLVSIRMFDNILQIICGYQPESCDMIGRCSVNAVIESDGSVYPCDFYVLDQWKLGTIIDDSFENLITSNLGNDFVKQSLDKPEKCLNCEYISICRTGCKRHHIINKDGIRENTFCESYKQFYKNTLPRFKEIAFKLSR